MTNKIRVHNEFLGLESYSFDILFVLLFNEEMRFNQLYRKLKELKIKGSKPKMQESLEELLQRDLILREEFPPQKVVYRINKEKFSILLDNKQAIDDAIDFYNHQNIPKKIPDLESQIIWFINNIILTCLYDLKMKIAMGIPLDQFFVNRSSIQKYFLLPYEEVFIEESIENPEFRKKAIQRIDQLIEFYRGEIDA
ncbi:MAG: hypothetical protein ACTSW1_14145 [Candidatus Hodarchaeales archaeon]